MQIFRVINQFLKLKPSIKLSVIFILLITIGSSAQLIQQIENYNINPFGFVNNIFAQLEQFTTGAQTQNKGGFNIGYYLGSADAEKIIDYQQNNSIQNGYALTIVDNLDQFDQTVSFVKKMSSVGVVTVVRFCVSSNCEFKFVGQEINQAHPMVDFCGRLQNKVGANSFICTTGPNEPGNPVESSHFGYSGVNLRDVVEKSIQLARIMKSRGIQTGTFAINLTNRQNDEVAALFGSPIFNDNKDAFDFVLANLYDTLQASAIKEYSKVINIGGNQISLQNFIEQNDLKVIFTEFGTVSKKADNLESLKNSTTYMCELNSTKGLILFRSFKEIMDEYPGLIDNPDAVDAGGNLIWPVQFAGSEVAQILSSCNNQSVAVEQPLIEFPVIANAERCILYNDRTGSPINNLDNCSYFWQSKAGFNMGDIPSPETLDTFRGVKDKEIPNLKLGGVLLLGLNTGSISQLASGVIDANQRGYMPVIRFCYRDQPDCDLTFDPEHPQSFAKACEQLYWATEAAQAQFICTVGPNEPSLEHGSFGMSSGNTPNYRPMVEGANKMADYLQKYRDRMFLAPALFNGSSCGALDDVYHYLYSPFAIKPNLFDYILANIYTLPEKDAYPQFANNGSEGICDRSQPSIKSYVEDHGLKFIATEFSRWDTSVSKSRFEQDINKLCRDESVDYFLYFDALKFGPYEDIDFSDDPNRATHPRISPSEAVRYSEMCIKNHEWVDFNFDTIIYPESKGESRAKVVSTEYKSDYNNTQSASAQLYLTCDQATCTANARRTIRVVSQTKGESSHVGTNRVNFPTLSQVNSALINLSHIDTLSKFSALSNISGKEYPIPYLGSYLNQTELLKYTIFNLDSQVGTVNTHPASLSVNSRLKKIKDESNGIFRGNQVLDDYFLIDNLKQRGNFLEGKFFEYKREYLREYDPFAFPVDKVEIVTEQPRNIVFHDVQNEIYGPEVVIDEIAISIPSIDICYEYAIRNTDREKNEDIMVLGTPQCDIKSTSDDATLYNFRGLRGTCQYILGVSPQNFCSPSVIRSGACQMDESLFKSCFKFSQMLDGTAYINTSNYHEPSNFEINNVFSSIHKLYSILNDNLYARGFRLNTGDAILSSKASIDSYLRDINLGARLAVTENPGLYAPIEEQLNYSLVDYETRQVSGIATASSADLFKNNSSLARGDSYKRFDFSINYLGFLSYFTELLTTYINDGASPSTEVPSEEPTNPFYQIPAVCSSDKFLCNQKHILAAKSAEMINTIPLFTCDEYHINQNYTRESLRELAITNGIDFENDPRYSFFSTQVDKAFGKPRSSGRLPCLESLNNIQKPGVLEIELCRRGYPVRGVCGESCPVNEQRADVVATVGDLQISNPSCPIKGGFCSQGPYGGVSHSCNPNGGSLAFDFNNISGGIYAPEDGKFYAGEGYENRKVMDYCIGNGVPVTMDMLYRRNPSKTTAEVDRIVNAAGGLSNALVYSPGGNLYFEGKSGLKYRFVHTNVNDSEVRQLLNIEFRGGQAVMVGNKHVTMHANPYGLGVPCMNSPHIHFESSYMGLGKNKDTLGRGAGDPYKFMTEVLGCTDSLVSCGVDGACGQNSIPPTSPTPELELKENSQDNNFQFCAPELDQDAENTKCNEFNCALSNPDNDKFLNSLGCATRTLSNNIFTRNLNLAQVVDRYGPFCDNEVRGVDNSGLSTSMPYAYNLIVNFYDKYKPPGSAGGRSCSEAPPSQVRSQDSIVAISPNGESTGQERKTCNDFRRKSDAIWEYEDTEAFDYYRGALVRCGLNQENMSWNQATSSFGSFSGIAKTLGDRDADISLKLRPMAQAIKNSDINYFGFAKISEVPEDKILEVLKQAYKENVNPFLLMGLWATESWFGLFNDINFKGAKPTCNFF